MDEQFTENDARAFLAHEWLVRIDRNSPYLFKFHAEQESTAARVLITDTKDVWSEAVNAKQLARRWRVLNPEIQAQELDDAAERTFRHNALASLAKMHTPPAIQTSVFAIEESRDADISFVLQNPHGSWRWDATRLGARTAASVLSQHLIFPLMSMTRLAFGSPDPVGDLSTADLEKAVDKLAKSGRRAQDVHVRQTLSRPRVATTLRRMTAMFNFAESIPPILDDEAEDGDVNMSAPAVDVPLDSQPQAGPSSTPAANRTRMPSQPDPPTIASQHTSPPPRDLEPPAPASASGAADADSATEPESDGSPAPRPSKKPKVNVLPEDSDDAEGEQKKGKKVGGGRPAVGVRQPIKRGGRRF